METRISIDKLTFVGRPVHDALNKLLEMLHVKNSWITPSARYHYNFQCVDESFIQMTAPKATDPQIRFEFNPNNIKDDNYFKCVASVMRLMKDPEPTRIDIAIDIYGEDLARYQFVDYKSRKRGRYESPHGRLETLYLGSRKSEEQIRIYDKALEQGIKKEAEEAGNHWWRIEAQLRGDKAKGKKKGKDGQAEPLLRINPFEGISIVKPAEILQGYDIQTRAMIEYLQRHPEAWNELSKNTRVKYKNLIGALGEQIEIDIAQIYETKKIDLYAEIEEWLNISQAANPSPLRFKNKL